MKKIMLLSVLLLIRVILPAQGVYQLWGMTSAGGTQNTGVIFSTDAAGNNFQLRQQFTSNIDGINPFGKLTLTGGKLHGMTSGGGISGVIFEWDPVTNIYTKKIDFTGLNGSAPFGDLTWYDGKFYGMTYSGGINITDGVIFEWDPATNEYTKKIDLFKTTGYNPVGTLTLKDNKFYAMASGGSYNDGVIFEWDPATNVYTKKLDFDGTNGRPDHGNLTLRDGKFYGMLAGGGFYNAGSIIEWDPETNVYTKKVDFNVTNGSTPRGSLTLNGGRFYGMTYVGGINNSGVIFEWDPVTNVYEKKYDFEDPQGTNGSYPFGTLTLSGGNFYGMASINDYSGKGVIFEWDPTTNIYTKKHDFKGTDGAYPGYGNGLTLAPAPVAKGQPGSCINFPAVTIDSSNNNKWVSITDSLGDAVAEIKANGNNLGMVSASMYINNASVREDENKKLYLDRNITLTPQVQPISPVDIRLYVKGSEFMALRNALNSNGDSSGIRSINDVVVYKNENDCSPNISVLTDTVSTKAEGWETDYVLTASISSFSSFYFAGKALPCTRPIIQCKADTVVNATDHHCGAVVRFNPPVVKDACGASTVTQIAGLHSGAFFPVGNTVNTFIARSSSGKSDTCSFTVTVKDTRPPFITPVWAFPSVLWPPNHKMKHVSVNYYAWDNCAPASCSLDVNSDEPVTGTGYGDKAPDWVILDNHHVLLRAERAGHGNGRTYTITVTCTDASGNTSTQNTKVFVPHHSKGHYSKGEYSFGAENDGYIDANGDYLDQFLDCKVTPNPSNQNFNLEIESASNEKIEVNLYDISGRFISKLNAVKNQIYRFGDDLRPGMYMVEVRQGQHRKTVKVVKQ